MASKKRCTNYMYVQQLDFLNLTIDELKRNCESDHSIKEFAMIVHDKDLKEDKSTYVEPHLHLFLNFKQQKSLKYVAELVSDKENYIDYFNKDTVPDKNERNGFLYLLHRTKSASHKHQYSIDELIVSDDSNIKQKIKKWEDNYFKFVKKNESSNRRAVVKKYLEQYSEFLIDFDELERKLNRYEIAKNMDVIKKIDTLRLKKLHQQYVEDERYKNKKVLWIYGSSGLGKTRLSKEIAQNFIDNNSSKRNQSIYMTQSNRDPFQDYTSENVIILEEFRSTTGIAENELFQILDKTNANFSAGSRYSDKKLMPDLVIINSIYAPTEVLTSEIIDVNQMIRRIDAILHLDKMNIAKQKYQDRQFYDFEVSKNHIYQPPKKDDEYDLKNILKGEFDVSRDSS
ncbi:TPA: replication initiator protein [Enterococcus faecium]|nr:replication initiator protein [Enterococcus faecium]HAR0507105.1 replication initiator protein [Enterococcus faecium]HAR0515926.1 replication initiator protein [Enterococcus faecium]HAR0521984.1 replication initiator protein [Enterococcus faecium]HAR0545791.1 replication initiator protein [Enterococcus faecium]